MADGINKVILMGNLGADPELRTTPGGQPVLKIRVATTERFKDKNEEWQERTEWHAVTVWGKRGEGLVKLLSKGARIFVEGRLHYSTSEKDGTKRYFTEVVATDVVVLNTTSWSRDQLRDGRDRDGRNGRDDRDGRGAGAPFASGAGSRAGGPAELEIPF